MTNHKFIDKDFGAELKIDDFKTNEFAILNKAPYTPKILILGTFNPDKNENVANFFYGRKNNYFWYAMRNIFQDAKLSSIKKKETELRIIYDICKKLGLSFSDLILSISCEMKGYGDGELEVAIKKGFATFNTDNIIKFLSEKESIKTIYFTRKPNIPWKKELEKIQENVKGRIFKSIHSPSGYAPCPKGRKKLDYVIECWETDMIDLINGLK